MCNLSLYGETLQLQNGGRPSNVAQSYTSSELRPSPTHRKIAVNKSWSEDGERMVETYFWCLSPGVRLLSSRASQGGDLSQLLITTQTRYSTDTVIHNKV